MQLQLGGRGLSIIGCFTAGPHAVQRMPTRRQVLRSPFESPGFFSAHHQSLRLNKLFVFVSGTMPGLKHCPQAQ